MTDMPSAVVEKAETLGKTQARLFGDCIASLEVNLSRCDRRKFPISSRQSRHAWIILNDNHEMSHFEMIANAACERYGVSQRSRLQMQMSLFAVLLCRDSFVSASHQTFSVGDAAIHDAATTT